MLLHSALRDASGGHIFLHPYVPAVRAFRCAVPSLRGHTFFWLVRKKYAKKRRWNDFYSASRRNSLTFGLSALIGKQNQPIETAEEIRPEPIHFTPHSTLSQNVCAAPAKYLSGRNAKLHCRRRTRNCTYFENVCSFRSTLHRTSFMRDAHSKPCKSRAYRHPYVKYLPHFDIPSANIVRAA